ncbi:MAG: patatin-like phospholipase family protein [Phenylobacterium sp.]|uniref:patatin-like phospholipase family protein n=1 Tax=Phenylobacterium sp. TaxID=1871053 RepID=UPI003BB59B42
MPARQRAFVAFAGGGAKGLVHVGALRAIEARDVEVVGYAGTSAGAIIAALAAAGVMSTEMIHPTEDRSIIDDLRKYDANIAKLTDLFGRGRWPTIRTLGWLTERIEKAGAPPQLLLAIGLLLLLVVLVATAFAGFSGGWEGSILALMVWIAGLTVLAIPVCLAADGLARVETLRHALGQYLSERVFGPGSPREVLMSDFNGEGLPRLKIIASDITRQRMQVFSCDILGETPVADAVAASICLPLVFAPKTIGSARFVDGGVVSNFPAWPFDEERALDGDALTIGFQIGEVVKVDAKPRRAAIWPIAVFQTALFGSVQLSTRAVGRAELITLKPSLKLLAFDIAYSKAREEVEDAAAGALAEIDRRLFQFPDTYRRACASVRDQVTTTLEAAPPGVLQTAGEVGRVRCAVALPQKDLSHSLAVRHGVGYEQDADGDLLLPLAASLAGEAWRTGDTKFEFYAIRLGVELWRDQDAAIRRRTPRDLAWSLRVPISSSAGEPFLVVLVDGSGVLMNSEVTTTWVASLADEIERVFRSVVQGFEEVA